jgi:hypothetical protein
MKSGMSPLERWIGCWVVGPFLIVGVASGCGGESGGKGKDFLPGDSLAPPALDSPVVKPETTGTRATDIPAGESAGAGRGTNVGTGTAGLVCGIDFENPARLDLKARWEGDHVRVSGTVPGGAGNALSLALSQGTRFVFDQVFKADLMGVLTLDSDQIDVRSIDYSPSASERAAFDRTGALPLNRAAPVCLDVTLYEKGSLDLLAAAHFVVEGMPGAR